MKNRFVSLAMIGLIGSFSICGCRSGKSPEPQPTSINEVFGPQVPVETEPDTEEPVVTTAAPTEEATVAPSTAPQIIDITVEEGNLGRPDLNNVKLEAKDMVYTDHNISVTYPQIVGLGDEEAQTFANDTLYEHMKAVVDHYVKDPENDQLTLTYETLTLYRGQYSVLYKGTYKGTSEPVNIAFTDNLNLMTSTNIRLGSRISKDSLKRSIFEVKDYTITESNAINDSYLISYLENESEEFFDALVQNADFGPDGSYPGGFSYSKGDEIRIIINLPHILGDYAEISLVRKTK
ncbi:MAG: hypothetical protein J6T50_01915 [Lachnospiraceae bacterium]|nr:hypothetical protein [Lachnospiraceae bacterium]